MNPNSGRAAFCRHAFTKYPRWIDSDGVSQALSTHPNYKICRNFRNRSLDTASQLRSSRSREAYELAEPWRSDIAAFVYGVHAEIGGRPGSYDQLRPVDSALPIGPGNVRWEHPGWHYGPRAQAAKVKAERFGLTPVEVAGIGGRLKPDFMATLLHRAGCESDWVSVVECTCVRGEVESAVEW